MLRSSGWLLGAGLALGLILGLVSNAMAHDGVCKSGAAAGEAVQSASRALQAKPDDLNLRLSLADALMVENCFEDAVHVLEEGEAAHGRNARFQSELREARSMLREQGYFEGLSRAEEAAKLSHSLLRCNKLGDVDACNQAQAQKPDDPQIAVAKGDALLKAKRSAEALDTYRRALQLAPGDAAIQQKIAATESQRRELDETCMNATGASALQACQASLLPGAKDEFALRKRIGILKQAANQPSEALDSYIAAQLLQRNDKSVALAIVTLSDSTGRKDVLALASRGSALLTLGRALEALTPLKQALALSPDLPEAKAQLAQAERLAQQEASKVARAERVAQAEMQSAAPEVKAEIVKPARSYSNAAPVTRSN